MNHENMQLAIGNKQYPVFSNQWEQYTTQDKISYFSLLISNCFSQ
jgi:hypothetical protein